MVVFDRFLARLLEYQPDQWVLKGGYALQLRLGERARTTKDMDLHMVSNMEEIHQVLRRAGGIDLGDWFTFEIPEPEQEIIDDFGGMRYQIQSLLDRRRFENFHIDVGVGDILIEPVDYLTTPNLLVFADINPTRVPCYSVTQQIGEKLHAYTRPRPSGESSRVKDFIDIMIFAELGEISGQGLIQTIEGTFLSAGTHPVPDNVPPPPRKWTRTFRRLANEINYRDISLGQAYQAIKDFLDPVLRGEVIGKVWDPSQWTWEYQIEGI